MEHVSKAFLGPACPSLDRHHIWGGGLHKTSTALPLQGLLLLLAYLFGLVRLVQ